jgi:hypothetical protein
MVTKFAKNSDVKMIIQEKQIATNQVKSLLRKKGIFSFVANAEELSNEIYPIYLGSSDIEKIKQLMQTESNYKKSSLMSLIPKDKETSIDDFLEMIGDELQKYRARLMKYKIESIQVDKSGSINMRMTYTKRNKGKVELIKDKIKELNVTFKKDMNNSKVLVDIRQNDNSDLKEFNNFLTQINSHGGSDKIFNLQYLTLDKLTRDNKIKFYDELIAHKYPEWVIEDIKGIDVKKGDEILDDEEDDGESLSSDELVGINSAMFKGNSIRDAGIVGKFEKQGFYFTSMKFKYAYISTTESFVIDINFKGTDNVKIDIMNTYDNSDTIVLPMKQQEEIIQEFQKVVNEIYNDIIASQVK